jgi:cob(I)alamin adenosyltransferase
VAKDHLRIRAYGTLDELNATIGLAVATSAGAHGLDATMASRLRRIQGELFQLGAELATPPGKSIHSATVGANEISELENEIDGMESVLSPLKHFILPGGSRHAAELHVARTICRRAEREMIALHREDKLRPETLQFVNRLSDYLFVAARMANHLGGQKDVEWIAPRH